MPRSSISSRGRYVAFDSVASDLVPDDANGVHDVFLHDRRTKKTQRVSLTSDGNEALSRPYFDGCGKPGSSLTGFRFYPSGRSISTEGRYVTYASTASNLVPNDGNGYLGVSCPPAGIDVFAYDRRTRRTERVSVHSNGTEFGDHPTSSAFVTSQALSPSISGNGRHVVFEGWDTVDKEGVSDEDYATLAFYDRSTGALQVARRPPSDDGFTWSGFAAFADISPTGRFVSYRDWYSRQAQFGAGFFRWDRGPELGVGSSGGSAANDGDDPDDRICIDEICLPPSGSVAFADYRGDVDRVSTNRGTDLIGGRVTHRGPQGDLFVVLELRSMPRTPALFAATRGVVYGMSLRIDDEPYEIRAASTGLGSRGETTAAFGLFSCPSQNLSCSKIADLEGGFGTTGEHVTFSLPLDVLRNRGRLDVSKVKAFTALGASDQPVQMQGQQILDRVTFDGHR
ncbi:MAG: hypothetical protein ACRDLB_11125 [Actinomycetota bacterium]